MTGLPLCPGDSGEATRDLQNRLRACGHDPGPPDGEFGPATEKAVREFQDSRSIRVDGECGPQTWSALVEAGYALGDRLLYHRTPMLRGDDVEDLQRCLNSLGFDPRWVDGIFGELTASALTDFQRNGGLSADGVCGPDTIAALRRLGTKLDAPDGVAVVRHREQLLTTPRLLRDRKITIGHDGSMDAVTRAIERALADAGAHTLLISHPDPSERAAQANNFAADLYVGVQLGDSCEVAFYRSDRFESEGGRNLAEILGGHVPAPFTDTPLPAVGLRLPVLRETRMPAVDCTFGPATALVEHAEALAAAVRHAVDLWISAPVDA